MGRFVHEAAAVDPDTGVVYLTEDDNPDCFYRFVADKYGHLRQAAPCRHSGSRAGRATTR